MPGFAWRPVAESRTVLRYSHERRSGFHQRDKISNWAHAPELPGCFVEGGAAPFEARRGRVVGHDKHLCPTRRGPYRAAAYDAWHRGYRKALRTGIGGRQLVLYVSLVSLGAFASERAAPGRYPTPRS